MAFRIAIARLWHEGNSFTPVLTRLANFREREWRAGPEAAEFYRGTRTEIGAAVDFFAANRTLTPIYLRCAAAGPGGPVEEADLQRIMAESLTAYGRRTPMRCICRSTARSSPRSPCAPILS